MRQLARLVAVSATVAVANCQFGTIKIDWVLSDAGDFSTPVLDLGEAEKAPLRHSPVSATERRKAASPSRPGLFQYIVSVQDACLERSERLDAEAQGIWHEAKRPIGQTPQGTICGWVLGKHDA